MAPLHSTARLLLSFVLAYSSSSLEACAQSKPVPAAESLPFPGLLKKAEREAGNPLATYAALLELEQQYRDSKVFAAIYPEVRCNYEEFLGMPLAGQAAMALPSLQANPTHDDVPIPNGFEPHPAIDVIARAAAHTRLVIFGEEHHLPQTRSLYAALLRRLWDLGYRYLAAETFTPAVMEPGFEVPDYHSGYYVMDPVFACAVRTAKQLGYRLIAYDTAERGPQGDASFRDRMQAQSLAKVLARDPSAKLLVLAGRGHAAEVPPADGWTPMASVLKKITGIDPFTIYAPTMSQRQTTAAEDPMYRYATAHDLVREPVVFTDHEGACLGSGHCDALVFWPRFAITDGRPDWLLRTMGRTRVPVPKALLEGKGLRLLQVFKAGEPGTAVPVDQVLLRPGEPAAAWMLEEGSFWARAIDAAGAVIGPVALKLP